MHFKVWHTLYDNPQALVVYTQQSAITIIWIQRVKNMMGVSAPQSQEELVRLENFQKKRKQFDLLLLSSGLGQHTQLHASGVRI